MRLHDIVDTSRRVAEASGRREKIEHLATCIRHAPANRVETVVGYLSGEPPQGRLGIGPAMLRDANPDAAAGSPRLTIDEVHGVFEQIVEARGPGATGQRVRLLRDLLRRATAEEQSFLRRLVIGELRQGALEGLMVDAVARAAGIPARQVRRATMVSGELGPVARIALTEGSTGLSRLAIRTFRPVKPMLAQPADDIADALDRLGEAALEYKMDGARVQVHKSGGDVAVFTRRLNDVSQSVPEIVEAARGLAVREIILDGEALAFRRDGQPHPFQVTMRRFGRKTDVARLRETLPLGPFFFDCLLIDGESIIDRSSEERALALQDGLPPELVIPRTVTDDAETAEAFLREALERGHEGVMAKSLTTTYEAGARGRGWLKVKPVHTLDLVVLAAEWGHGRRRGRLSNLHLGARDPAPGGFVMLGKTFKGMTDEMLEWQTGKLLELEAARDAYTVHVRPELVVEVAFNDIQASPQYPGGMALRFARVKRYRPDKHARDADTVETVRRIFESQTAPKR